MSKVYFIYVNPDDLDKPGNDISVRVDYLIGYCPDELGYYKQMAEVLKAAFPSIDVDLVGCHKVTRSDCYKSFTMVTTRVNTTKEKLGLPNPDRWAEMKSELQSHQRFPHLDKHRTVTTLGDFSWYMTVHPCDYNY